jgi:hypothetical protein
MTSNINRGIMATIFVAAAALVIAAAISTCGMSITT